LERQLVVDGIDNTEEGVFRPLAGGENGGVPRFALPPVLLKNLFRHSDAALFRGGVDQGDLPGVTVDEEHHFPFRLSRDGNGIEAGLLGESEEMATHVGVDESVRKGRDGAHDELARPRKGTFPAKRSSGNSENILGAVVARCGCGPLLDEPETVPPSSKKELPRFRGDNLDGKLLGSEIDAQQSICIAPLHLFRVIGYSGNRPHGSLSLFLSA
jgi:hypothetical protein